MRACIALYFLFMIAVSICFMELAIKHIAEFTINNISFRAHKQKENKIKMNGHRNVFMSRFGE